MRLLLQGFCWGYRIEQVILNRPRPHLRVLAAPAAEVYCLSNANDTQGRDAIAVWSFRFRPWALRAYLDG